MKYNTQQLEPAVTFNVRYRLWIRLGSLAVYERIKVILLLAAQSFMLLTSSIVASVLSLLTGMLNGNIRKFHHEVSSRVSQLHVINHQREQVGAKDSSLRYASIDVYELCCYSTNQDSLFSVIQMLLIFMRLIFMLII